MKYLITESKIESLIKDFILKSFNVVDVEFDTQRVYLGSGPNDKGQTDIEKKVIMITLNNLIDKKTASELRETTREIARALSGFFGIDFLNYGSEWDLKFYQIKKEQL